MSNILKRTGAISHADLYKKIYDPSVNTEDIQALRAVIKNPLIHKEYNHVTIKNDTKVKDLIKNTDIAKSHSNKTTFLLLDALLNIKDVVYFDLKTEPIHEVARALVKEGISKVIPAFDASQRDGIYEKFSELQEIIDPFNKKFLDHIFYDNQYVYNFPILEDIKTSSRVFEAEPYDRSKDSALKPFTLDKKETILDVDGVQSFLDYVSNKEIKGLNLIKDEEEINTLLQHRLNHLAIEKALILIADEDGNIMSAPEISKGIEDRASIFFNHIYEALASNPKHKNLVMVHNHPAGGREFSDSDIKLTECLDKSMKGLGYCLVDHLLVINDQGVKQYSLEHRSMEYRTALEERVQQQELQI